MPPSNTEPATFPQRPPQPRWLRLRPRLALTVLLLASQAIALRAAEFSVLILDGLDRPVSGATVELWAAPKAASNSTVRVSLGKVLSGTNGMAKGTYDEKQLTAGDTLTIEISKAGYSTILGGPQTDYVLKRLFTAADVPRIAKLPAETQRAELRELLAGDFDATGQPLPELVFVNERLLRPPLRALVPDLRLGTKAGELLAFIGVPDDLRLLVQYAPTPRRDPTANRWAAKVVASLVDPPSEREWAFLKKCALNEYNDRWVDLVAIQSLRLNASPRSLEILADVRKSNKLRTKEVDEAVHYINSKPPSLEDANLIEAAKRVALAVSVGEWRTNQPPRFNELRDKALVDCESVSGRLLVVHTAAFQKTNEVWVLRGVRESHESMLSKPMGSAENKTAK